ncbi:MAG: hypothetical protein K1X71_05715 [Pirellulales bacterium]|nr:hypothetical protein [Pirellulales bacterium]
MSRLRKLITLTVFWACVGISLAAGYQLWRQGIPTGQADNHWAVDRIAAADFPSLSMDEKLRLARRLERDFSRGVDLREQVARLSDAQNEQFEDHFLELTEIWFLNKVDTYDAFSDDWRRRRFLEEQMTRIKSWPTFDRHHAGDESERGEDALQRLVAHVFSRMRSMPVGQRQRIQRFVTAVVMHGYRLEAFMPGVRPG